MTRRRMLAMAAGAVAAGAAGGVLLGCGPGRAHANGFMGAQGVAPSRGIDGPGALRVHAADRGLLTGFAVRPDLLANDARYKEIVQAQASLLVAENAMKWAALRPSAATYRFEEADGLLAFAEQNRMKLRGHNLLWHRDNPAWLARTATRENARELLVAHIEQVVGRYAGRMHSWDVVNEAIEVKDGRADGFRRSMWLELVGDDYIEVAFRTARRADPQALLTYNDYDIESESAAAEAKRTAVLMMLRRMRARRVPIDAVGVQSHLSAAPDVRPDPRFVYGPGLMRFIASVRELDLQVFVTEMDVNDRALPRGVKERDAAVAETYGRYLETVLRDPAVTAVVFWGVTDRFTWLNHEDARVDHVSERPLLFQEDDRPAEAFFAVRDAFDGRAGRA